MNIPASRPILTIKANELALNWAIKTSSAVQDGCKGLSRGMTLFFVK